MPYSFEIIRLTLYKDIFRKITANKYFARRGLMILLLKSLIKQDRLKELDFLKKCNPLRIYRAYIRRGASITPLDMLNLNVPQSGIHKKWLSNHF